MDWVLIVSVTLLIGQKKHSVRGIFIPKRCVLICFITQSTGFNYNIEIIILEPVDTI